MKLTKLLERLKYEVVQGSDQIEVGELINDSRKVSEGSVFVCIRGAVSDGHAYVGEVAAKGGAAVIVEREVETPEGLTVIRVEDTRYALALMSAAYFGYPAEKLKVIGITGTKGKTTTTYMVKSILEEVGHKVGLIGTIEALIQDQAIPASNTTPESYTIQKYFAQMVEAGCDSVVMEVSSRDSCSIGQRGSPLRSGSSPILGRIISVPMSIRILKITSAVRACCSSSAGSASEILTISGLTMCSGVPPARSRHLGFPRKQILEQ